MSNETVTESTPLNGLSGLSGQCLCGQVRYEVDKIEPLMGHCHCSMCRKFHGAAFATFGEALAENFRWVAGQELLQRYQAPNGSVRQFCRVCGSSLTFAASAAATDVVEFSLGTLDSPLEQMPDAHIFVAYKANWVTITDGLPQHAEERG